MEEIRINFYHYMNSQQDPNYHLYKKLQGLSTELRELELYKEKGIRQGTTPQGYYSQTGEGAVIIRRKKSEVEAARAAIDAVEPIAAGTLIIKHRGASLEYTVLSTAGKIRGIVFNKEPDIGGVVVKFNRHNSTISRLSALGQEFVPYFDTYSQHIFLKEDDAKRLYDFYTNRLAQLEAGLRLGVGGLLPPVPPGGGGGRRKNKSRKH